MNLLVHGQDRMVPAPTREPCGVNSGNIGYYHQIRHSVIPVKTGLKIRTRRVMIQAEQVS